MSSNDSVLISPDDQFNRKLVANAHPQDWQNPVPDGKYNMVVIGAGTAGLVCAAGAAGLGARVALIEKHLMGGDCLNVGCVPSKCLIKSSRIAAELKNAAKYGVGDSGAGAPDFGETMDRMRRIRADISEHDSVSRFSSLGIDVFLGEGRFTGPDTAAVGETELKFRKAVIATGARAAVPPIDGLAEAGYLTNETVFSLISIPRRFVVLGGGPIGCELAQAFSRLGSEVTMIVRSRLLSREEPDASELMQQVFEAEGIKVLSGATVRKVTGGAGGRTLTVETASGDVAVEADEILVAIGRAPNVEGIGLEKAGVKFDTRRGVEVGDNLRTANPDIYAAGDVCMAEKFTHAADFAARIVIQNALFKGSKKLSGLTIPRATYTDPEIAQVGLNETEAKKAGIDVDVYTVPMDDVDRALADGEEKGWVKVCVAKGRDRIVGATIIASHAGDMISEISVAMAGGVGLGKLASVIHPYPTQADALRKVGDAYNRTRLTPFLKKAFKKWLAWQRK